MIDTISDVLLIAGALGLAGYCWVLSRRLQALGRSDAGLGASIAALGEQVESLSRTTDAAVSEADSAGGRLAALIEEADRHEAELSVILAGLSDMDELDAEAEAETRRRREADLAPDAAPDMTRDGEPDAPATAQPAAGTLFSTRRMAGAVR